MATITTEIDMDKFREKLDDLFSYDEIEDIIEALEDSSRHL